MIILNPKDNPMPLKYYFICNKCDCEWLAQENEIKTQFMDGTNQEYYTLVPAVIPIMCCPKCNNTTHGRTVTLIMKL